LGGIPTGLKKGAENVWTFTANRDSFLEVGNIPPTRGILYTVMLIYRILADVVVVFHAMYVGFVVLGMLAILLGVALGWHWVRSFWFRIIHLAMIGGVVFLSVTGITCPITVWEKHLRDMGGDEPYPGSFIGYWVHELLMIENVEPWVFAVCYSLFGAAVFLALVLAPPRWPWSESVRRTAGT
jgi:uncharacterized protein DUF2784